MSPSVRGRVGGRPWLLLALLFVVAACSGAAAPSFDPSGPCTVNGKRAGAYPELEALIPASFGGKAAQTLDSGRNCTSVELGTLASHGVTELRFAGGVWPDGNSGVTLAVFTAPGLQSEWLAEWYEAGARAARVTGNIQLSKPTIADRPGQRLDVVNGEAPQTVITWPSTRPDTINVVITSDEPEDRIQAAVAAFP
jgi:hypothetical protein